MRGRSTLMLSAILVVSSVTALAGVPDIHSVNWRDFSYAKSPDSIVSDGTDVIVLHNGKSKPKSPTDPEITRLDTARYADFKGDGHEEAAVQLVTPVVGRRAEEDTVYVFEWRDGKPHQIFQKMYASGTKMRVSGHSLQILEADATPPDPVHWTESIVEWKKDSFRTISTRHVAPP